MVGLFVLSLPCAVGPLRSLHATLRDLTHQLLRLCHLSTGPHVYESKHRRHMQGFNLKAQTNELHTFQAEEWGEPPLEAKEVTLFWELAIVSLKL